MACLVELVQVRDDTGSAFRKTLVNLDQVCLFRPIYDENDQLDNFTEIFFTYDEQAPLVVAHNYNDLCRILHQQVNYITTLR